MSIFANFFNFFFPKQPSEEEIQTISCPEKKEKLPENIEKLLNDIEDPEKEDQAIKTIAQAIKDIIRK